ncbi:PREDICTED: uncharacterized protein LOC104812690 [Tarenaya hassleriana]|uniref:uncharacterized protein LOC104812690 n=1 Tax=Tarenaya hassleriana TaxID=28532 RepID=UPI00053C749F|nr:PREDICTED: uncharacterized protein LOC104812690 [Tarenaya hassleriana]
MAAVTPTKSHPANPCCAAWQLECEKMKRMRRAYKETVDLLKNALEKEQEEIRNLKKKQQEEGVKADVDRETKEKEESARVSLEKEVSDLKSELSSLQQRLEESLEEKNAEMMLLRGQVSKGDKEIHQLKDLLRKEKLRADSVEEERKKVCEKLRNIEALKDENKKKKDTDDVLKRLLENEKQRAEVERKKAESEKNKADKYLSELEVLRTNADKTGSELIALRNSFEIVSKQLNLEKQKRSKEKKHTVMEFAKAKEQMKLMEDLSKELERVKGSNEELRNKMELQIASSKAKNAEDSTKLEEHVRLLEMHKKMAMDWKSRADDLAQQLKEARLVTEDLQKRQEELSSSQKSAETMTILPHKVRHLESAEVELLRKELKFEKKRVKHAKQLAKLEKVRREVLVDELGRLKVEFAHFSNRLNLLDDYFSSDVEGTDDRQKAKGCRTLLRLNELSQVNLISKNKPCDARCNIVTRSGCQEQARQFTAQLISKSGRHLSESAAGTISELKSLIGGSKKFATCGVNSSATSFSDGQFIASQERGQFSVTTSAEIGKDNMDIQTTNANMSPRISDASNNENLCLVGENHLQSHQTDSSELVSERKRMVEAVESLKYLYSEDRKLRSRIGEKVMTLQSMLVGNVSRPFVEEETSLPDVQDGSCINRGANPKKKRGLCEMNTITQRCDESKQSKKIKLADAKTCEDPLTSGKTPEPTGNPKGSNYTSVERICLSSANRRETATLGFEEVDATNYMKLLELDKSEDEECYKLAIEVPLSPNLPEIDFQVGEMVVGDDQNPSRALDLVGGNSGDLFDTQNPLMALGMSSVQAKVCEYGPLRGHIPKYLVLFSNIKNRGSVIRIVHATNKCIHRCPSAAKVESAFQEILLSLKMEKNLSVLERACVLLSSLLHNFSMDASMKIGNTLNIDTLSCLDSFSRRIYGVIADADSRAMLSEILDELLGLLQDFLCEQRVLCSVTSSDTSESSINVCLDGENVAFHKRVAPIDCLVTSSAIFAAICASVNGVGFICEASFEILYKKSHEKNTSVLLTILHVFVYVAGEKLLSSREHNLPITVLKSIIKFLEDSYLHTKESEAELHPGKECPFSDESSSLEDVASLLLEILQKFAQSKTMHQSLTSSSASDPVPIAEKTKISPMLEDFPFLLDARCEASCCLHKNQSENMDTGALCQLCDVLSLVELVAGYMAWDWTSANVVAPLLKMLETPLEMDFSIAIVSLLGQLGSIGVESGGYEDGGIESLRDKLSELLQCETRSLKAGFTVQIATVSSLLKLLPPDCVKIGQNAAAATTKLADPPRISSPAALVAKWLSLLSDEQRAFSSEFLQASSPLVAR